MTTLLRRLFWLALLAGAGYGAWSLWQRRAADAPAGTAEWPPLDTSERAPVATDATRSATATAADVDAPTWVEPVDGRCPDGYPIKANDNSGIYHVPGGRSYDRTVPERCYATADAAAADGYRAAKA